MKLLTGLVVLLMAGSAAAHNSCNLDLNGGLRITENAIEFYEDDRSIYKIVDDKHLEVRGKIQKLTSAQQSLVANYANHIRAAIPEVKGLALDGIDLAIEGVVLVFDGLLGEKNKVSAQLTTELTNLKGDINRHFNSGAAISFNRKEGDNTTDLLGKQFETRLERIVETSVQESIGSLMLAVGKEFLSSGGNMDAFERRMERFGEEMELQMNARAVQMEARGEKLCNAMVEIDSIEEQLKRSITELESFNVIKVSEQEMHLAHQVNNH
ncbi:MAG: DUF2884 family protein [Cellvibrio sp.]|uniref:DUF2884 family protein n=1 Tax=Cellvibrio sp. TaxID=1965322 RepID=UPI0031B40D1D